MAFNPYNDGQIEAAENLLQLIVPEADYINSIMECFEEALTDIDDEEAPIYAVIQQVLGVNAGFFVPIDDNELLIEQLFQLSEFWGAYVQFGSRDWEGAFTEYTDVQALMYAAAIELKSYDLTLWEWDCSEEMVAGFIARTMDDEYVTSLAKGCGAELWRVIDRRQRMSDDDINW